MGILFHREKEGKDPGEPLTESAWCTKGYSLAALGRFEEAVAAYDRTVTLKPDYTDAWVGRGTTLAALGRFEEAVADYDHAIALKPDDTIAWHGRGALLATLGRRKEAVASFDRAIALKPDDEPSPIEAAPSAAFAMFESVSMAFTSVALGVLRRRPRPSEKNGDKRHSGNGSESTEA